MSISLSPKSMKLNPFSIGPIGIQVIHSALPHFAHDASDRVNQVFSKKGPNGVYDITFSKNLAGNTIFLPFAPNEIRSIRLPGNPGPGGATYFLTANLDGCCIFLDLKANGDIVVYHANATTGVAPTAQQSATLPTFQTPACLTQLHTLYTNASTYYPGANTHHVGFRKTRYLQEVDRRLIHKTQHARTGHQFGGNAEHASLTTFAGFFVNNKWEFWFQTYSQFIYERPATHWKSKLGFQSVNPNPFNDAYEVVETAQVFRAP